MPRDDYILQGFHALKPYHRKSSLRIEVMDPQFAPCQEPEREVPLLLILQGGRLGWNELPERTDGSHRQELKDGNSLNPQVRSLRRA